MEHRFVFAILLLVILVVAIAHIFACERREKMTADEVELAGDDIMQYIIAV